MITRLLLSLKKANASQEYGWNLGEPTVHTTMRFAERRGDVSRDEMHLDTFASTHEETQSQIGGVKDVTGDFAASLHGAHALEDFPT